MMEFILEINQYFLLGVLVVCCVGLAFVQFKLDEWRDEGLDE